MNQIEQRKATSRQLIDRLNKEKQLDHESWKQLILEHTPGDAAYAAKLAHEIAIDQFGKKIYFRGIIEFTNYCKNDCLYCGIRKSNLNAHRYRLTKEQILEINAKLNKVKAPKKK